MQSFSTEALTVKMERKILREEIFRIKNDQILENSFSKGVLNNLRELKKTLKSEKLLSNWMIRK